MSKNETETLEERCQRVILGWQWMAFDSKQRDGSYRRERVILSPEGMADSGNWWFVLRDRNGAPANMTEPRYDGWPGNMNVVFAVEESLRRRDCWDEYLKAIPKIPRVGRELDRPHVPSDRVMLSAALSVVDPVPPARSGNEGQ